MNFGGGQYVTRGNSKSWKRRPARTYKSAFIEHCTKSDAKVAPLLKLQIGLEISARTWNAGESPPGMRFVYHRRNARTQKLVWPHRRHRTSTVLLIVSAPAGTKETIPGAKE
ncbi:uncharacterized protein EURHEDRAFT_206435 [Aspergillus ruber CBS 135680]|uniref:Uncharacterized protein n=1 Tax=Aspergillus ruber (strain CBS 135680) TaxID=1388766 RepID=A0A017SNE6_ASPRC|nr:uncharacterized protein EURHEDRAFT_206435 [Aspergillus ruber CBS 135680]EYE98331.1 hypothetical protein EURHEDRAFT_206435 [Aspergillus ruber CBS 135680]